MGIKTGISESNELCRGRERMLQLRRTGQAHTPILQRLFSWRPRGVKVCWKCLLIFLNPLPKTASHRIQYAEECTSGWPKLSKERIPQRRDWQAQHYLMQRVFPISHWKRPRCWERLRTGGEGDDRGWDGWMASLTQWTRVWANSRRYWSTGKPGVLHPVRLQRIRHDLQEQCQPPAPCPLPSL